MWLDSPSSVSGHEVKTALVQPCSVKSSAASVKNGEMWASIDSQLSEWLNDPSQIVDSDALPPPRDLIRAARAWIVALQWRQWPAPETVVPNGDGGLSFEFYTGDVYRDLEFCKNGGIWLTELRGGRFQRRSPLEQA